MDRFVNAVALALTVGQTAQAGAGEEADAAGNNGGLVADDVAKQVAGDDDAVKGAGVLDHDHGSAVDELVGELELGELVGKDLGDDLAPKAAGGQHVGLIQAPHLGRRVLGQGEEAAEAGDALNLGAAVGLRVHGEARAVVLLAVAKVDAAGELAHDDEVGAAADLGLERRAVDEGLGGKVARAQVAVGTKLLAQLQDALLGADGRVGAPFRAANGTEENGVGGAGSSDGLVGAGVIVRIDRSLCFEQRVLIPHPVGPALFLGVTEMVAGRQNLHHRGGVLGS